MKLESQVCSLELAKKLKELGVRQESAFYWCGKELQIKTTLGYSSWGCESPSGTPDVVMDEEYDQFFDEPAISAFTTSELGEMLPYYFLSFCYYGEWTCKQLDHERIIKLEPETFADSEANCRAEMLVYLIEQGIIKPFQGEI